MASALLGMIIFMAVVNVFGNYKKVRTESETSSEVPMSTENHAAHVKEPSTV
jgi:Tfp pilus assembly protein PilW